MHALSEAVSLRLDEVESDADFILLCPNHRLISEHCTVGEARMALFKEAGRYSLGEHLPVIYRREEPYWVPLSLSSC